MPNSWGFYKIGITIRKTNTRFIGRNHRIEAIKTWPFKDCYEALELERHILKEAPQNRIIHESFGDDKTEFFDKDILNLDKKEKNDSMFNG